MDIKHLAFADIRDSKSSEHICINWTTVAITRDILFHLLHNTMTIIKYNNAKRSIPAHPTFVNDTHRDLHLQINRVSHG